MWCFAKKKRTTAVDCSGVLSWWSSICSLGHCECDGHTVHKFSQRRLTADWLAPRESDCSRMHSKVSSDWLPSYIKATRPVLEIFKKWTDTFRTALVHKRNLTQTSPSTNSIMFYIYYTQIAHASCIYPGYLEEVTSFLNVCSVYCNLLQIYGRNMTELCIINTQNTAKLVGGEICVY